jgi:RNA polymerase-binding transcription factor DksA
MSTTADILGLNRNANAFRKWSKQYADLCVERDRLLARDSSPQESSAVKLDDISDAAADESERGLAFVAARATHASIVDVLEAIRRIETGTYGICELTGKPIEAERLEALPWARYSLEGQRELEKAGLTQRHALPGLDLVSETVTADEDGESEGETEKAE